MIRKGVKYMRGKAKKATFSLHPEVLAALDEAVANGAAPSKNILVERALEKELKEFRRRVRQVQWREGAGDPLLIKDVSEIEAAYKSADAETARRIG